MKKKLVYLFSCFFILFSLHLCAQQTNKNTDPNGNIDSLLIRFATLSSNTNLGDPDRNYTDSIKMFILFVLSNRYTNIEYSPGKALQCTISALAIANRTGDKKFISTAIRKIGNIHFDLLHSDKAIKYYLVSMKVAEDAKDTVDIAGCLNNIGNVYNYLGELFNSKPDYEKARDYLIRSINIQRKGDSSRITLPLLNIINSYHGLDQNEKAVICSIDIMNRFAKKEEQGGVDLARANLAEIYLDMFKKTGQALYLTKAKKEFSILFSLYKDREDSKQKTTAFVGMGAVLVSENRSNEAIYYLTQGIKMARKLQNKEALKNTAFVLAEALYAKGDYKQALEYHKIFINISDTLLKQQSKNQITEMSAKYESEKNDNDIELLTKDTALQTVAVNKQKFIRNGFIIGLGLSLLSAFMLYNRYQLKQKLNTTLSNTNNELTQKNTIIEKQKEKIINSINYALLIQQSILMENEEIQKLLPNSFIFYKPKDIVSGDFYWLSKINDKIIIAVVDCTGHGVSGALMSLIGNTLLNRIVNENQITVPSEILRLLNIGIYEALHQGKEETLSGDGMDMALCTIDYKNNQLEYAGAENPLYMLSNNEITIFEADRQPVGGRSSSKKSDPLKRTYTNHVIPIKEDMTIYLFSDGYMDQFGSSERKKFGIQKFKDLLLGIQDLNMQKQKDLIAAEHENWKKNTQQIDDILVMGIRI
jgi:serine phosphatase RsbU (regulator of sigma subunit)